MKRMYVVGEDRLSCALGARMVSETRGWSLAQEPIATGGVTKLRASLARYMGLTRLHPVLCLADTDRKCAIELLATWLPANVPPGFLLRLAVTEAESWLLADSEALADFLGVAQARIPDSPDEVDDAKLAVIALARRSRKRLIREEVVSALDTNKQGAGYNAHLCEFAARHWRPAEARRRSPSLERAMARLSALVVG